MIHSPGKNGCRSPTSASVSMRWSRDCCSWRVQDGPDREVYFEQVAVPGREAAFDFTDGSDLGVTIGGVPFAHLLFEWVLSYSKWTYVGLALSETFEALVAGLQGALWTLGAVPAVLRHDNLSAATHELKRSGGRQLTARFQQVLDHYGLDRRRPHDRVKPRRRAGAPAVRGRAAGCRHRCRVLSPGLRGGAVDEPRYAGVAEGRRDPLRAAGRGAAGRKRRPRPRAARPFRDGACAGELGARPHCGGRFPMSESTAVTADHLRRLACLYALPRASDFPRFELDNTVTPTPVNPLGAKGVGEVRAIHRQCRRRRPDRFRRAAPRHDAAAREAVAHHSGPRDSQQFRPLIEPATL